MTATVRGIIGNRTAIYLACAYPGILSNLVVGQNGFVTAAFLGGGLLWLLYGTETALVGMAIVLGASALMLGLYGLLKLLEILARERD